MSGAPPTGSPNWGPVLHQRHQAFGPRQEPRPDLLHVLADVAADKREFTREQQRQDLAAFETRLRRRTRRIEVAIFAPLAILFALAIAAFAAEAMAH